MPVHLKRLVKAVLPISIRNRLRASFLPQSANNDLFWKRQKKENIEGYWALITDSTNAFLADVFNDLDFESVLELGSNCGNRLHTIAKQKPDGRFYGIDISRRAVKLGTQWLREEGIKNVELNVMNVTRIGEFNTNQFDIVFSRATLMYINPNQILNVLSNAMRVARKYLILIEMHQTMPERPNEQLGVLYPPRNWKRDYVALLTQIGISPKEITCRKIPKNLWDPGGGGAHLIMAKMTEHT